MKIVPKDHRVGVGCGNCGGLVHAYNTLDHIDCCTQCGRSSETMTVPVKWMDEEAGKLPQLIAAVKLALKDPGMSASQRRLLVQAVEAVEDEATKIMEGLLAAEDTTV